MFFLIMTGYILLAYLIFPVEDNIWKVPDYYLAISVLTSSAFVVLYERWQKRRKPKHLPNEPLVISDELLDHSPLGNKPVQEVHAGKEMYQCQIGAVMTNRYFTPSGREIAEKTGVLLWDRDWLRDAINRRQIG